MHQRLRSINDGIVGCNQGVSGQGHPGHIPVRQLAVEPEIVQQHLRKGEAGPWGGKHESYVETDPAVVHMLCWGRNRSDLQAPAGKRQRLVKCGGANVPIPDNAQGIALVDIELIGIIYTCGC